MSPVPLVIFSLLSLTVNARPHPCDTLIISSFTFSLLPNPNPNPSPDVISVVTTTTATDLHPHHHLRHRFFLPRHLPHQNNNGEFLRLASLKDVLSVVASLLLGGACGALAAVTMYLICSLFTCRSLEEVSSDDDDDEGDDHDDPDSDVFNPKKNGYVAIPPPPPPVVEADLSVAPAKESA